MIIPFSMLTGERAAMDSGISVGDSWYFNSAYYDSESALLFWSAFDIAADDEDVELFAIDADYSGNVYSMGTFAPSVWPVGGLFELNDYDYAYGESAFRSGAVQTGQAGPDRQDPVRCNSSGSHVRTCCLR